MATIDFTAIEYADSLGEAPKLHDVARGIGEILYKSATTLWQDKLARAVYDSRGEIELTEQEGKWIADTMNGAGILYHIKEPIFKALGIE